MDLLIIKTGDNYIRVLEDGFRVCGMDKASVFPLDQVERVRTHVRNLEKSKYGDVRIHKLTITETPFEGI